jgi:GTP-binding protein
LSAIRITGADFLTTAAGRDSWPPPRAPEYAFVGRSNVGKSSMINTLCQRRKLVRVSNTPGRTRTLNFFQVAVEQGGKTTLARLTDLPGYGFAKASKAERGTWKRMIGEYLAGRDGLRAVVSIIDAEIGPTSDDMQMLDFLQEQAPRVLVAATKIDRLNKASRKPTLWKIAEQLELPQAAVLGFSATEPLGFEEVWRALLTVG